MQLGALSRTRFLLDRERVVVGTLGGVTFLPAETQLIPRTPISSPPAEPLS